MLILIAGGSSTERRDARRSLVSTAMEELDSAAVTAEELATTAGTPTLTGDPRAFFMRGAFSSTPTQEPQDTGADLREELFSIAEGLVQSPHTFVFEEEKIPLKAVVEKLKKAGAKIELFVAPEKKEKFNVFAMAQAFAKRDRKDAWLFLMVALRQGVAAENIVGVLSWKARTMLVSARNSEERQVLEKVSRELVRLYHDSHRGSGDLALLLERFVLTL